jgi:hypothetical protein
VRRAGRFLAVVAFAAIVAGGIEPFYFRALTLDAPRWRAALTEMPYRKLPGYRRFLMDVDARTPIGARIAIWIPLPGWEGAYGYGYYRAPFLLTGKQVVPLQVPFVDKPAPQNVAQADWVAAWHGAPAIPGFEFAWRSEDGVLMRRTW